MTLVRACLQQRPSVGANSWRSAASHAGVKSFVLEQRDKQDLSTSASVSDEEIKACGSQ